MPIDSDIRSRLTEPSQEAAVLELIIITHDQLDAPLRYVNNDPNESINSQGDLYQAFPFQMTLPSRGEELPRARVTIGNVDRRIGEILRQITTPLEIEIRLIYSDAPDEPFEIYSGLKLRNVDWNGITVEGELQDDDFSQEPVPAMRATQDRFQALHRL